MSLLNNLGENSLRYIIVIKVDVLCPSKKVDKFKF